MTIFIIISYNKTGLSIGQLENKLRWTLKAMTHTDAQTAYLG